MRVFAHQMHQNWPQDAFVLGAHFPSEFTWKVMEMRRMGAVGFEPTKA